MENLEYPVQSIPHPTGHELMGIRQKLGRHGEDRLNRSR